MRIAIQNPFAGKFSAETELSKRLTVAIKNLGWQYAEVFSAEDIKAFVPDFVLSLHYHSPKLTEYPTYGCMWNPPSFFEGTEKFVKSVLSYDGYLVSSEAIAHHLNQLLYNTSKTFFTAPFYTSCYQYPYQNPNLENPHLVYLGVNWDGSRYQNLFTELDKQDYMDIYGLETGWSYLEHSYRGDIPRDGVSVLKTLNQAGIGLCLHKKEHRQTATPSMRIFEIVASGAIAICEEHDFIKEAFGDTVLYLDPALKPIEKVERISELVHWIKDNPRTALEMSSEAYSIFQENYSLEKLLSKIVPYHQELIHRKGLVETVDSTFLPSQSSASKSSVQFIIPLHSKTNLKNLQTTLESVTKQTYSNVNALIVTEKQTLDLENLLEGYREKLPIQLLEYGAVQYRSSLLTKGLAQVNSSYFGVLEPGTFIHPNHVFTLVRLLEQSPHSAVAYSGLIRVVDPSENYKLEDTRNMPKLLAFSSFSLNQLLSFESPISCNSLIARSSLLQPLPLDPQLPIFEDLCLLLFLAQKSTFLFSYEATCELYVGSYHLEDDSFGDRIDPHLIEKAKASLKLLFWQQEFPNGKSLQRIEEEKREQQAREAEFERWREAIATSHNELETAQARIAAMETSKFWKLRSLWFKVKRSLGLPIDE